MKSMKKRHAKICQRHLSQQQEPLPTQRASLHPKVPRECSCASAARPRSASQYQPGRMGGDDHVSASFYMVILGNFHHWKGGKANGGHIRCFRGPFSESLALRIGRNSKGHWKVAISLGYNTLILVIHKNAHSQFRDALQNSQQPAQYTVFFSHKKKGTWFPFNKVCAKTLRFFALQKAGVCVFQNRHPTYTSNKCMWKKTTSPSFSLSFHCCLHYKKNWEKTPSPLVWTGICFAGMAPWSFQACLSGSGRTSSNLEFFFLKKTSTPQKTTGSKSLLWHQDMFISIDFSIFFKYTYTYIILR